MARFDDALEVMDDIELQEQGTRNAKIQEERQPNRKDYGSKLHILAMKHDEMMKGSLI